ncbi:hypothetical protein DSO57_1018409 [Entomophthora muscae]|uniref:Uncharacterized protein n=1 Tax=Entomophthora muscae TaxID=34485 RepID=A0ACC2STG8_9FUNG|nr:hypothetical protein DSO57_1018409 [Entomophthora muscae]
MQEHWDLLVGSRPVLGLAPGRVWCAFGLGRCGLGHDCPPVLSPRPPFLSLAIFALHLLRSFPSPPCSTF